MAAKTDCRADEGETDTVPVRAVARGVVSSKARPNEYIHICKCKPKKKTKKIYIIQDYQNLSQC